MAARPLDHQAPAANVTYGRFTSVQVNVNGAGANIIGDAANEPSIAVDPTSHDRMVIGWRQFDTISSNFRQAGYGFSIDGGQTWTAGKIEPGVFRSDPVVEFDADGECFYSSLSTSTGPATNQMFRSVDGGANWGSAVWANGGDKQWITIDRSSGSGRGFVYQAWSTASNAYGKNTFDRSIDGGASFQAPSKITNSPVWGTLDVAPDGTLYVGGTTLVGSPFYVDRSTNAKNPGVVPTFTSVSPYLGGILWTGYMNPEGLLGQVWLAVDHSSGPHAGWVYMLASVLTPSYALDVHFIRSTDGGQTWSNPVRVNDDPPGNRAYHWFGTMSVAPNGRIDVIWNDTRGSADSTLSALYYSYSSDGGTTWSASECASPTWRCTLGWPNQQKIGDYYDMVSDDFGADLAWAATFNGEEDVYYLRITPSVTAVAGAPSLPVRLHPSLPNPFTISTTLTFEMPAGGGRARLDVIDPAGRRVATLVDGVVGGGAHEARWAGIDESGRPVKPGLYLCRLDARGVSETRKVLLLR